MMNCELPGGNGAELNLRKLKRAWELDFARGTAVLLMSAFHAVFDLSVYFNIDISYSGGFWFYIGRFSAVLFMFVSGISSSFSKKTVKRGFTVLGYGMLITAVSIPIMGENYIRFGILHFFGTVMVLKGTAELFIKDKRVMNITAGCLIPVSVILWRVFSGITVNVPFLLPLGIMPKGFSSYDYYPLFPWLAFFSAGVLAGAALYREKRSVFTYQPRGFAVKAVCFLGKHSLVVYIVHQPVIMAALYIIFSISKILS